LTTMPQHNNMWGISALLFGCRPISVSLAQLFSMLSIGSGIRMRLNLPDLFSIPSTNTSVSPMTIAEKGINVPA